VVIPAIVLTFVVKGLAAWLDPALAAEYLRDDLRLSNIVGSLLFLNESWGMTTVLPWNGPYWSLCYEAWYYVIFGLAVFAPPRHRGWAVVLACVAAGLPILMMFPLWLLGAALARQGGRWVPSPGWAALLWPGSIVSGVLLHASGLPTDIQQWLYQNVPGYWRLNSSQRFVTDYAYGALVAINFLALRGLIGSVAPMLKAVTVPVQWLAGSLLSG
jgi:peptidoglycan/LPS O-acetylase OafA/YrhL